MSPVEQARYERLQAVVEGYDVRKDRTTELRTMEDGSSMRVARTERTTRSDLYAALQQALGLVRDLDAKLATAAAWADPYQSAQHEP